MRLPRMIMGCGHSTFNLIEEGMACGPKRRMIESHSKNNLLDNNDPSTKQLLLKDGREVGPNNHARNASSESVVMKKPLLMQPQMRMEREKGESGVVVSKFERGTEEKDEMDDDDECERTKEDDDDFGRRISDFNGNWIGSPSFREYCVDDSDSDDQDAVNHGRGNRELMKKKAKGTDSLVCNEEVCVLPRAKRLEKKESRGRKFTRVFPTMHGPKNLWHVATRNIRNNHHVPSNKLPVKV